MVKTALDYLKLGLLPLPCMGEGDSKGKVPLVKWRELQELPSEDQIKEWFNKFPAANIGFKTGKVSGILVLDNDGVEIKEPLPITPIATSRPGHFHYYFKNPNFYVPPSTSKVGEHLDIRCDQGFIVAPPSHHFKKETGEPDGKYEWIKGAAPDDIPFANCPDWLILKIKQETTKTHGYDWSTALNVGIGARDDTLKSAAASLIGKGFDKDTAIAILRGINATYSPPLADNVVIGKLESAIRFIGEQRAKNDFLIGQPIPWNKITADGGKREWVWENYIAKGNITLLSALWKAGKSTLLRHLFIAIGEEKEFAGQPASKSKILVISEEDKNEWFDQKEGLEDKNLEHILVWSRPIRIKPNLKQWIELVEKLTEKCLEEKIDFIVIDTITTFWPVENENDSAQVIRALVPLYNFTENRIAVLLVHHFRKGGGDQAQASRGSGALPGFVDNIVEFTRKEDGMPTQRILKTYGRFDAVIPQVVIDLTPDDEYITLGEPWEVSKKARMNKIIGIFEENKDKKLSVKDVKNFWLSSGSTVTERSVRRYIIELVNNKIVSAVDIILSNKKKTPIYQLCEDYSGQRTMIYPPTMIPVLSSVITEERTGINGKEGEIVRSSSIGQKGFIDQAAKVLGIDDDLPF